MAVTNVGLSALTSTSTDYTTGYKLYSGKADAPIYLKWRTISGTDIIKSFDIAINYRYIPRGNTGSKNGCYTDWQADWASSWTNIAVSKCNPKQTKGKSGWQWSLDFATLLGLCGIKGGFTDDADFGFGSRKFDQAEIEVHIKAQLASGGASERTDVTLYIGAYPKYVIGRVYCDTTDEVSIEYSAAGWERVDDCWDLLAMKAGGKSIMPSSKPGGAVSRHSASGNGTITIPVSKLKSNPIGKSTSLTVRFNPAYRASGAEFVNASYSGTCENDAECNTPTLSISTDGERVYVKVGDAGDKDKAVTSCLVKLEGSEFAFDQQEVEVGETAVFDYLPRGVPLEFSAVATAGEGTVSASATGTCPALATTLPLTLVSLSDPDVRAVAKYDVKLDDDYKAERQTIKLAGRKRPSAFYGEGGVASWNLSLSLVHAAAEAYEDEASWRKVSSSGDCVMMLLDGTRKAVSLDQVRFSRSHPSITSVTATLTEVDA